MNAIEREPQSPEKVQFSTKLCTLFESLIHEYPEVQWGLERMYGKVADLARDELSRDNPNVFEVIRDLQSYLGGMRLKPDGTDYLKPEQYPDVSAIRLKLIQGVSEIALANSQGLLEWDKPYGILLTSENSREVPPVATVRTKKTRNAIAAVVALSAGLAGSIAITQESDTYNRWMGDYNASAEQNDPEEAAKHYKRVLDNNPGDKELIKWFVRYYSDAFEQARKTQDFEKAESLIQPILTLTEDDPFWRKAFMTSFVEMYLDQSQPQKAKQYAGQLPQDTDSYHKAMARIYEQAGQSKRAADHYLKLAKITGGYGLWKYSLKACQIDPKNERARIQLITSSIEQSDSNNDDKPVKQALEVFPDNFQLKAALVRLYEKKAQLAEANGQINEAIDWHQKTLEVYGGRGLHRTKQKLRQLRAPKKPTKLDQINEDRSKKGLLPLKGKTGSLSPNRSSKGQSKAEILTSKVPVLVYFTADWCVPCKKQTPQVDQLASGLDEWAKVIKVDQTNNSELGDEFGVKKLPALKIFKDGKELDDLAKGGTTFFTAAELATHLQQAASK